MQFLKGLLIAGVVDAGCPNGAVSVSTVLEDSLSMRCIQPLRLKDLQPMVSPRLCRF